VRHVQLTVRKVWATYNGTDPKYVVRRVKLTYMLSWEKHASEHEVICGCKPTGEKYGEDKTAAKLLGVAETRTRRAKAPTWCIKCRIGLMTLPSAPLLEQPAEVR
jgi:hypothetical protein